MCRGEVGGGGREVGKRGGRGEVVNYSKKTCEVSCPWREGYMYPYT